jgi:hypothetical protein
MRKNGELNGIEFCPDFLPEIVPDPDPNVTEFRNTKLTIRLNQDRAQLVHDNARSGRAMACINKSFNVK